MTNIISEASSKVYGELKEVVSKDMDVFYNPVMRINRDMTILILSAEDKKAMKIADPLAGSGIRALRLLKEVDEKYPDKIGTILVNDKKYDFKNYFEKNIELNKLTKSQKEKLEVHNEDASIFMLQRKVFDYIDIDPFGTPNPFLDAAAQSIKNKGILAVTATDTSSLCGSYPSAGKRKYWSVPLRNELMHEFGVRILVRKIQLIGAQYDHALIPIFSYSKDHYMKVFLRCENGKKKVDDMLKNHCSLNVKGDEYGPVWQGQLWDTKLLEKITKLSETMDVHKETKKFISIIAEESKINVPFFVDMHELARKKKTGDIPRFEKIIENLTKKGFKASRTHFSVTGIKTDAPEKEVERIFEEEMKNKKK